jgi:uncharacterized membrane protein YcaP (DUF421 family)
MPGWLLSLLVVAGHTLVIYLFLIFALSRVGRRQIAQVTSVEFMIIAVLGSAVETAMVAGNTSLPAGLVSASTLLLTNRALAELVGRSGLLRRILVGAPVLLVSNGEILRSHLRRIGFTEEDVRGLLRERGYDDPSQVRFAYLEIDGSIGVVPMSTKVRQGADVLYQDKVR